MTNDTMTPPLGRKTTRQNPRRHPTLDEPVIVAEFKKGRSGDTVRISLRMYEGIPLIDIRTWFPDDAGGRRPGKGFAAHARHLHEIFRGVRDAVAKAVELDLIEAE